MVRVQYGESVVRVESTPKLRLSSWNLLSIHRGQLVRPLNGITHSLMTKWSRPCGVSPSVIDSVQSLRVAAQSKTRLISKALRDHGWYSKRLERGGVELNYCGSPAANGTGFSFYSAEASQEEEQERRDKISAACKGKLATNKDHQWDEIMRSPDPTDEQVEALLGVKLTGSGKEQIILAITQIDAALGEKAKKERYARTVLKKILVFLSQ